MTIDFKTLLPDSDPKPPRLLIEAVLKPIQGSRFQPTGFPDLGPALFDTIDGQTLLVESAQSMANRLEATIWDEADKQLVPAIRGLSYVRVEQDGRYLTSSITEAHRVNSPYILESKDETFFDTLQEETNTLAKGPIDRRILARTLFKYDVNALLHGVFLAKKELAGGRLRLERALSAFIEAKGARVASSGGVKNDQVDPSGDTSAGFGNVPFQRDEYTAQEIKAFFSLDLAQIRAYGLNPDQERLLVALALFKVATFLDGRLRLRTACDLELDGPPRVTRPEGFKYPSLSALREELPELVSRCKGAFGGKEGVTTVKYVA